MTTAHTLTILRNSLLGWQQHYNHKVLTATTSKEYATAVQQRADVESEIFRTDEELSRIS